MVLLVRVGTEEEFWEVEGCEGSWMFKTSAPLLRRKGTPRSFPPKRTTTQLTHHVLRVLGVNKNNEFELNHFLGLILKLEECSRIRVLNCIYFSETSKFISWNRNRGNFRAAASKIWTSASSIVIRGSTPQLVFYTYHNIYP